MDVYGFWQEMKLTEKYSAERFCNDSQWQGRL